MDAFSWGLREPYNAISLRLNGQKELNFKQVFCPQSTTSQFMIPFIRFPSDSWSIPFVLSSICLFFQIIHILLHWINTFRKPGSVIQVESDSLTDTMTSTFSHSLKNKVKSLGGWAIYSFMVARLLGCLVLFALSVNSLLRYQKNHPGVDTVYKHLLVGCPEAFMTLTFVNPFPSFFFVIIPDIMIDSSFTVP